LRAEAGLGAKRTGMRERRPEGGKKELGPDTSETEHDPYFGPYAGGEESAVL